MHSIVSMCTVAMAPRLFNKDTLNLQPISRMLLFNLVALAFSFHCLTHG